MIEELKPYSEYKDPELPWLGECPKSWKLRRTKILFHERVEKGYAGEPLLAATQSKGVVRKEDYGTRTVTAQKDLHLLKLVEIGDYVISLRSFQGGIEVAHYRGIISPAYTVLEPKAVAQTGYYTHYFKSKPFVDSLSLFVTGIREGQNIDYERLSRAELPCPPPDEQDAIVRFLDHANRKIDHFIHSKRNLIALLNEQKQTIIQRAVTRGLAAAKAAQANTEDVRDPSRNQEPQATTKRSIPWLDSIPGNWSIASSRRFFTPRKERARDGDVQLSATQAYGVIPQEEFEKLVGRRVVKISLHLEKRRHVEKDDFVMSMRSFQGGLERAWTSGCIRSSYVVLKPSADVNTDFFAYLLKSRGFISALQATSNFIRDGQDLNFGNFLLVDLPVVPVSEQVDIAAFLDEASSAIDTAAKRASREIELLEEFKTRLAADIVTGKLDVREAAKNLPDLSEVVDPMSEIDLPKEDLLEESEMEEVHE